MHIQVLLRWIDVHCLRFRDGGVLIVVFSPAPGLNWLFLCHLGDGGPHGC